MSTMSSMSTATTARAATASTSVVAMSSCRRQCLVGVVGVVGATTTTIPAQQRSSFASLSQSLARRRRRASALARVAAAGGVSSSSLSRSSTSSSSSPLFSERSRGRPRSLLVAAATKTAVGGANDDGDGADGSDDKSNFDSDAPSFFAGAPETALAGSLTSSRQGDRGNSGASGDGEGGNAAAMASAAAAASTTSTSTSSSSSSSPLPSPPAAALAAAAEVLEIMASSAGWFYEYLRWGPEGEEAARRKRVDRLQALRDAVDGTGAGKEERQRDASPSSSSSSSSSRSSAASASPTPDHDEAFVDLLDELVRARQYDEVISRVSSRRFSRSAGEETERPPLPERAAAAFLEALVASGRLRAEYVLPKGAPPGAALLPAPGNEHASLPALLSDLSERVGGGGGDGGGVGGEGGKKRKSKVPLPGRSPSRPIHVAVYAPAPATLAAANGGGGGAIRGAGGASLLSSSASTPSSSSSSALATVVGSLVSSLAMLLGLGALFVMGAGVARRHAVLSSASAAAAAAQQQSPSSSSQPGMPPGSSSSGGGGGVQSPYGGGGFPGSNSNPLSSTGPNSTAGYAPKEYSGEDVPEHSKVKFDDVKGVDEAKAELAEVVDFLKCPSKFQALGGKLPKGVLLTGPPGTGKTMLARAVAGEAGVPFFFRAGSEFEEMFVGVGARRARALFAAAKKAAPCIVFIDEIDAVGGNRRAWENHSRKTLNQLLVEMDGFEPTEGVIVVAATNAADTLDPALVRPGRFDRQVAVPLPDVRGRLEILEHYLRSKPLARDEAEAAARVAEAAKAEAAAAATGGENAASSAASAGGGRLIPSLQQQQQQQPPPLPWGRGSIFGGSNNGPSPSSSAVPPSPFPSLLSAAPTTPSSTSSSTTSTSTSTPPPPLQTVDLPLLAGTIARRTPGFSGAQLASMVNEAALLAARKGLGAITPSLLDEARDKVLMGAERRSLVQSRVNRRLTAYHEAGHALVASLTSGARPIHKATIVPRGHALGMVAQLPDGDETSVSRLQLRAEVDVSLGGMAAELLVFGPDGVTTGARSDLKQATRVARHMIAECGMSDVVGPRFVSSSSSSESGSSSSSSSSDPDTARLVDAEVGAFLREARDRVAALLKQRERDLHRLAGALLEHETLTGDDVAAVLAGTFSKAPPVAGGGGAGGGKEEKEVLAALGVDVDGGIGEMARKKR